MSRATTIVLAILVTALAGVFNPAPAEERQLLYYQDPSGKPDYSPTPKKDAQGRDFVPVYDEPDAAPAPSPPSPAGERKILYYRNPMGLPDTSPVPKKDTMGMDYIPVYADEGGTTVPGTVAISPERIQMLGVRTEAAARRGMAHTVRAVGTVAADERRIGVVNPKFEGWIEKLLVNTTGQTVRRGEALLEVYSPDLVLAQREYLLARSAAAEMAHADAMARDNAKAIADAALSRLKNWDISADQLTRLQRSGSATRTLTLRAPIAGVVMDKQAVGGLHFGAGDMLYRIVDLSTVWLLADVYEQDLAQIRPGESATITVQAIPATCSRVGLPSSTRPSTPRPAPPECASKFRTPNCCLRPICMRQLRSRRPSRAQPCLRCRTPRCSTPAPGRRSWSIAAKGALSRARSSSAPAAVVMSR